MEIEEGFYPAINLATLLYVKGERIPESELLADMHIKLVWFLGRHGDMAEVTNFWTVATIFEVFFVSFVPSHSLRQLANAQTRTPHT